MIQNDSHFLVHLQNFIFKGVIVGPDVKKARYSHVTVLISSASLVTRVIRSVLVLFLSLGIEGREGQLF